MDIFLRRSCFLSFLTESLHSPALCVFQINSQGIEGKRIFVFLIAFPNCLIPANFHDTDPSVCCRDCGFGKGGNSMKVLVHINVFGFSRQTRNSKTKLKKNKSKNSFNFSGKIKKKETKPKEKKRSFWLFVQTKTKPFFLRFAQMCVCVCVSFKSGEEQNTPWSDRL